MTINVSVSSQVKVYYMEKNSSLMLWSIRTWKRKRKNVNAKEIKDISDKLLKWPHKIMSVTLIKVSIHHKNTINLNSIQQIK